MNVHAKSADANGTGADEWRDGRSRQPVPDFLRIDCDESARQITDAIRGQVRKSMRRRGAVLGLSGGIDSAVTAALCVDALGASNVRAILMPERDSDPESLALGRRVAEHLGIDVHVEDIEPMLNAFGCYSRRDEAIRQLVPEFDGTWKCKVVLPGIEARKGFAISSLVVEAPDGTRVRKRMPADVYLAVVAATNLKQRTRKQLEYYYADRYNYAVAGTPNRLEYDQGFFVKGGDGAADFKPIAHLYKSQVYQLAEHYRIPDEIRRRPPTTDTWSLEQSQEEFYFSLPLQAMDICLFGLNADFSEEYTANAAGLTVYQVRAVWDDITSKRKATRYLHMPAVTVEPVPEIDF